LHKIYNKIHTFIIFFLNLLNLPSCAAVVAVIVDNGYVGAVGQTLQNKTKATR